MGECECCHNSVFVPSTETLTLSTLATCDHHSFHGSIHTSEMVSFGGGWMDGWMAVPEWEGFIVCGGE